MRKRNRVWLYGSLAVTVFGIWHYFDVGSGAAASGDAWLKEQYVLLGAVILAGLWGLGICLWRRDQNRNQIPLERIYIGTGLFLGILYMLVLPPLSAPDEVSHYISAVQLSSRILGEPSNADSGHVLVRARDLWVEDLDCDREYVMEADGYLHTDGDGPGVRILGQVLMEDTYRAIREQGPKAQRILEGRDDVGEDTKAVSVHPPVVTTPVAYLPQALGIALARLLGLNTIGLLYMGRFFNLLFFTAMTYLSMRRLPFGKEVLFGVALLPMTLHLSASMSYDVMIMGGMFYLTALCLDLAFEKEKVTVRDVAVMVLIMAGAGPCKMVYGVLMGLCLLIPVKKFGGVKGWAVSALIVGGAWALAMAVVNSRVIVMIAADTESFVPWGEEAAYSLGYVLHHPYQTLKICYQTLLWQTEFYHVSMIGGYMSNLDEILDVPYPVVILFTLWLLGLAMKKPGESQRMTVGNRIWIGTVCAGCAALTMFSMLIAWTALSSATISGVQGRYFLPFLPVLLMALKNDTIILTKNGNRSILYLMCCANGYVLLRLYAIVCMRM